MFKEGLEVESAVWGGWPNRKSIHGLLNGGAYCSQSTNQTPNEKRGATPKRLCKSIISLWP